MSHFYLKNQYLSRRLENYRDLTEIAWDQGEMNDGRPWLASLWEDQEGDKTLSLAFPAMDHEEDIGWAKPGFTVRDMSEYRVH